MARLSERDAREWRGLAERIGHTIEPRLSPGVLANRGPVTLRPLPVGPSLRRARSTARRLGAGAEQVLRTDVRSFYPSVTPSLAFRSLVRLDIEPDVASRTATMLERWGSEGYEGLPIGPPGSAIIANAILAPVDGALERFPFLRWVDDYLISLRAEDEAAQALERVQASLEKLGLEMSKRKTSVSPGGAGLLWPGTYLRDDLADRELEDVGRPL